MQYILLIEIKLNNYIIIIYKKKYIYNYYILFTKSHISSDVKLNNSISFICLKIESLNNFIFPLYFFNS